MRWLDVEPQSPEWKAARLGKLGSSEFSKVLTPVERKVSAQSSSVMFRILAELITGEPVENSEYRTEWMDRGVEMEDQAYRAYEAISDNETMRGGIFLADDGVLCCSPDRLIGDDGDLELKAPLIHTQIKYALEGGLAKEYNMQIQGRLMITGRKWVDIFSFHPRLILPAVRVFRDEKLISELRVGLDVFVKMLLEKRLLLEEKFGPFTRPEPEAEPAEFLTAEDGDRIMESLKS